MRTQTLKVIIIMISMITVSTAIEDEQNLAVYDPNISH
jgi:hypothetical protein